MITAFTIRDHFMTAPRPVGQRKVTSLVPKKNGKGQGGAVATYSNEGNEPMPVAAPQVCGCGHTYTTEERCPCARRREAERKRRHDAKRPNASARGYDSKWRRESKAFLALPENRYCACGCGRPADTVDHKVPHKGDMRLFWDRSNWQPLASSPCHDRKKQAAERRAKRVAS